MPQGCEGETAKTKGAEFSAMELEAIELQSARSTIVVALGVRLSSVAHTSEATEKPEFSSGR